MVRYLYHIWVIVKIYYNNPVSLMDLYRGCVFNLSGIKDLYYVILGYDNRLEIFWFVSWWTFILLWGSIENLLFISGLSLTFDKSLIVILLMIHSLRTLFRFVYEYLFLNIGIYRNNNLSHIFIYVKYDEIFYVFIVLSFQYLFLITYIFILIT